MTRPRVIHEYSFCESVRASALSAIHIRAVDPTVGPKPNGGLFSKTMCDRDIDGGWDLSEEVTVVSAMLPGTCVKCFEEWRRRT